MALSPANLTVVSGVSRSNVTATLLAMKPYVAASLWVGKKNRYSFDTVNKIQQELAAGGIARPRQLSQYIAASTILHCGDGWSYLGRSLSALLKGDPHRARHLAYYAELRAAMSLLASVGVGVFNNKHFVIDAPTSIVALNGQQGTHKFVWDCLVAWGALPSSGDLFARVVKPHGVELASWLQPVGGAAALAKDWFIQWGMDLQVTAADQYARNESSYRPDGMSHTWALKASEVLTFVREFWASMEPASASRFENVDSHVLRVGLESSFRGTIGCSPKQKPSAYKEFVTKAVVAQSLEESATKRWIEFLCRRVAPDDILCMKYSKIAPTVRAQSHFSVLSRAALLLRLATGSALELETDIGLSAKDTSFWWGAIGNCRGMWDGARTETEIMDLWADIEPVLAGVDHFQARVPSPDQTFYRLGNEISPDVSHLGSCERIAIWGLTPS